MNQLALNFTFADVQIRTITTAVNEIWFVLKDVCDALGHTNSRMVFKRLDDDEKGVTQIYTLGGVQEMQVVNEPGLYNVILRSDSEKAKPFRRWVTHDVLPAIRKQGYYSLFSDEETLEIITRKIALGLETPSNLPMMKRPSFADKLNKQTLKQDALEVIRAKRYEQIRQLWISDFYTAETSDFTRKLQDICRGDPTLYHKYFDEYCKQKSPKFNGIVTI